MEDLFEGISDSSYQKQVKDSLKRNNVLPETIRFNWKIPREIARDFLRRFETQRYKVSSTNQFVTKSEVMAQLMWLWAHLRNDVELGGDIFNQVWPDHVKPYTPRSKKPLQGQPRPQKNPNEKRGRKPTRQIIMPLEQHLAPIEKPELPKEAGT